MVFCNSTFTNGSSIITTVTILILIDGFLQYKNEMYFRNRTNSHNPYFNRWFSAIMFEHIIEHLVNDVTILILIDGFLQ